jgi:branched-chain amino acid transport system permease protein
MELFLQRVVDGLGNGCIYAALALAIVLVFQTSGVINFAQGEMAMLSTFGVWIFVSWGLNIWLAMLAAAAISFPIGALVERTLIARIDVHDTLSNVLVMTGLFILCGGAGLLFFGSDGRYLPNLFPDGVLRLGEARVPYSTLGALASLAAMSLALFTFIRFTKAGLGLRAVAQNRESSGLSGLPVRRLLAAGWGLAAALGTVCGVLVTSMGLYLEPSMMLPVLVYAMAAGTLGGFDSAVGSVVAGLLLGVAESLTVGYVSVLGSDLSLAAALVLMLVGMIVRPDGIFGSAKAVRA